LRSALFLRWLQGRDGVVIEWNPRSADVVLGSAQRSRFAQLARVFPRCTSSSKECGFSSIADWSWMGAHSLGAAGSRRGDL